MRTLRPSTGNLYWLEVSNDLFIQVLVRAINQQLHHLWVAEFFVTHQRAAHTDLVELLDNLCVETQRCVLLYHDGTLAEKVVMSSMANEFADPP